MTRARTLADNATGKSVKMDTFTSSGTWTCPTGVTVIDILAVAGGGGGGSATTDTNYFSAGGSGGGAQILRKTLSVTPGTTYTVTIGAGGTGSTSNTSAGGVGGSTSFANGATTLLTTLGGGGGASKTVSTIIYPSVNCFNGGGDAAGSATNSPFGGSGGSSGNYTFTNNYAYGNQYTGGVANNNGSTSTVYAANGLNDVINGYNLYVSSRTGLEGFGGSGGGSLAFSGTSESTAAFEQCNIGIDGGASGVKSANPGSATGANGVANTGGGGSGGASSKSNSTVNGGNGGSGRIEIGYVA